MKITGKILAGLGGISVVASSIILGVLNPPTDKELLDGGVQKIDGGTPVEEVEKVSAFFTSIDSGYKVKIIGINIVDKIPIEDPDLGKIIEISEVDIGEDSKCNIILVAPETVLNGKEVPVVSSVEIGSNWGKNGNSFPVKIPNAKHPLPNFYWNVLLSKNYCLLVANERYAYLASTWDQILMLSDSIKLDIVWVNALIEERSNAGAIQVIKDFRYGDPILDSAIKFNYMFIPHNWAGRSDLNISSQ